MRKILITEKEYRQGKRDRERLIIIKGIHEKERELFKRKDKILNQIKVVDIKKRKNHGRDKI